MKHGCAAHLRQNHGMEDLERTRWPGSHELCAWEPGSVTLYRFVIAAPPKLAHESHITAPGSQRSPTQEWRP
jgi:hypothetical protein